VAAIMTLVDTLIQNPEIQHGDVAIGFTSDEEIGKGIESFDVESFGAKFAYTVDGETIGEINDETWSARAATVTFLGKSTHPGTAIAVDAPIPAADENLAALLGKQFGVRPPGWREAAGGYGEEGAFRSVADIVDTDSLEKVRAHKREMKAAAKS